jgi:hypothetical protein
MTQGITLEYKRTDEYKQLYGMVKEHEPNLPDYLVDMAISLHRADPKLYKKQPKNMPPVSRSPSTKSFVVDDAINVYDADKAPKVEPIKLAELAGPKDEVAE